MISPRTIHLLIRHFDSIDAAVSKRMVRKRPWLETALTSFLCDLLDEEVQSEEKLDYPLETLNHDLAQGDGATHVSFLIETHEYGPDVERWITQSDLGLVINYRDYMLPEDSWSVAWLLQAKRLTPNPGDFRTYTESSRFGGMDAEQKKRINTLRGAVGIDFILYLLYSPRPSFLDEVTQKKLAHLRTKYLTNDIYDFTLGLELRDDFLSGNSTLAAGLFISEIDHLARNLGTLHAQILNGCWPFSWFLAVHFASGIRRDHIRPEGARVKIYPDGRPHRIRRPEEQNAEWAHGIVKGDPTAIRRVQTTLGIERDTEFRFLPAHTLVIDIAVGRDLNPEFRTINLE